jgi:hypothetical protein
MILHQMSDVKPFHLSLPPPLNFSPEQRRGIGMGAFIYKYFAPLELPNCWWSLSLVEALSLPPPFFLLSQHFSPEQRCGKGKGTLVYKYFAPLELSVSAFSFAFFSCQLPPLA